MKLQQLRYIWEVAHHDLNVSATAQSLYTSQPGISKQIRLLEDELGVEVFARSGKHLTRVTPAGERIITTAGEILRKVESIKQIAQEFSNEKKGTLSIATTHTQARYTLPKVVQAFMIKFPKVRLSLLQGNPQQIAEMVQRDQADLAIATESIAGVTGLITLPCYQWEHVVVVAPEHPLLKSKSVTLEEIAAFPIITYDSAFAGRSKIDHAFSLRGLKLDVLLEAIDADVIKTYVELGMGIGIIAGMAFDAERDKNLRAIPVGHLFGMNVSRVAVKQGAYLRSYIYTFIELLAPTLNRKLIEQAMSGAKDHYEL